MQYIFDASLIEKKQVADNTFEFTFKLSDKSFSFAPGQYIWLILEKLKFRDPKGGRRAFSITNSPDKEGVVSVLFRESKSGYKQTLVSLRIGSNVKISGPFGSAYTIKPHISKPVVLIAGGVGLSPFLSILRSYHLIDKPPKLTLVNINSIPERVPFIDDIAKIAGSFDIKFINHAGKFNPEIIRDLAKDKESLFYICGPNEFVQAVYGILNKSGISVENMRFEQFYPEKQNSLTEDIFSQNKEGKSIIFRALQDSRNHVVVTDANGFVIFANKKAQRVTGYTFEEMRGNTPRLWGGIEPAKIYPKLWQMINSEEGFDGELSNRRKNGEVYKVIAHISPIRDASKNIIGYIGTEEDVTEIERLKTKFSSIVETAQDAIITIDASGAIQLWNRGAELMFGYSEKEMIGQELSKIMPDNFRNSHQAGMHRVSLGGEKHVIGKGPTEMEGLRKDGSSFPIKLTLSEWSVAEEKYFTGIIRDISKEKEIDREKTEFISLASHQLRTPLSTIGWYLDLVLNGDAGKLNKEQKNFLDEAYKGSKRMVQLVNALLNVSRIESGTFMVNPKEIDLIALVKSIVNESGPMIKNKKLTLDFKNDNLGKIMLDENLMIIIFQNLLTNSIKYTNTGGKINVEIRKIKAGAVESGMAADKDSVLIKVSDNGVGIPKNQQSKMFEKLFRADNVKKMQAEGTGLGLYLVKSLIEHSGGKIWFKSDPGKGTDFFVTLPLAGMAKKEGTRELSAQIGVE